MGLLVRLDPRRRPADHSAYGAMDVQTALREARRAAAPMWEAALATGDWSLLAETHALAGLIRTTERQARRVAGLAEAVRCADGITGINHGRAA